METQNLILPGRAGAKIFLITHWVSAVDLTKTLRHCFRSDCSSSIKVHLKNSTILQGLVEGAGFSNALASLAMTMIIYTWATSYCTRRHYKCFDLNCIQTLWKYFLGVSKSVCVQVLMKVDLNKEVSRVYGLSEHLLALADWTLCLVR